ncbi:M16 family metallopeptidase [Luteimonas deserti]|uniref:Insulinase family protein n=1 Tax=Luteimonas deserti TaxID=2752306 RepID=A0A7Z0TXZ8_9GAMM|nr:pitrilysin family protein [Luteimonas deserti]NYZ61852.1 insulinase family protein [Luteimonas deserti]
MHRRLGAVLLALCMALGATMAAQAQAPRLEAPVHSAEGIDEYRFDNGLRLVLFPDASRPVTTVNVTYRVGSRHEGYGETGMAHLLEHLVFKGTPTHPDIPGAMRARGIRFNGTTWYDRTNYFASFARDDDTLAWLLRLEADRMVNSRIARADLDSEMTVVRNEMESGENNPARVLMQRVMGAAYQWHNYGNATIGARSDVENVPIERLQAFYRTWYQPDNAVLVIAGDFDPAQALALVDRHFGALPRPQRALPVTYTREAPQDGPRHVVVRRVGRTPYLAAGYHVPGARHADAAALSVLAHVLGQTPGGRLHRALVERGPATGVSATHYSLDEAGYFSVLVQAQEDADLDGLEATLLGAMERAGETPFTQAEVDEARQAQLAGFERAMRDPNAIGIALSEAIAQGDWRLWLLARDRLESVTVDDVARVAGTYLRLDNRTSGRFVPTDASDRVTVPEAPAAEALLESYTGREALMAGEPFDPSPANIDARTRTWTLSNGARLAVLDKRTRGGAVQVRMTLRLGDADSLHGLAESGAMTGAMLMRGAGRYDRAALSRELTRLRSILSVGGNATSINVGATTDRTNVDGLLELLAVVLREPTFPAEEFEQLRIQSITGIRGSMSEPGAVANQAMARHFDVFTPGHPYHSPSFMARIAALETLDVDDLRGFHRRFHGMGPGATIAIVGDVDAEAVRAQLERLFGDWAQATPFTRIPFPPTAPAPAHVRLHTPDRANAAFMARQPLALDQDHPDFPALLLGNEILGGGGMTSRLADRIRQRDGLSYTVSSSLTANVFDPVGSFSGYAIAAPDNIDRVEQAFREELQRLIETDIPATELGDTLDGLLRARRATRASDIQLVGMLNDNLYLGRDLAFSAAFEERLRALTPEQVRAAIARHLDPAQLSVFLGGDFGAAETPMVP